MSVIKTTLGPFAGIFVGNYGDTDVLTQIFDINTDPVDIFDGMAEEVLPVISYNSGQSGLRTVRATVSFYGDSRIPVNLARGSSVSQSDKGAGSIFEQYVLLLVDADETAESSVLITKCRTTKNLKINRDKKAATKIDIEFIGQDRNRFNEFLYIKSADDLSMILGSRSPI